MGKIYCMECPINPRPTPLTKNLQIYPFFQASLRLAIMVQSPHFDGKVPNWFHYKCFFQRARPKAVGDISHYDSLRWEDQVFTKWKLR